MSRLLMGLKPLVALVVALLLVLPVQAHASGLVSTAEALALEEGARAENLVASYLARADVAAELESLGVAPELARLRAESLSHSELQELAERIEEAPAGGDGVLTVLGITFLVLLILELTGVIDIFKKA